MLKTILKVVLKVLKWFFILSIVSVIIFRFVPVPFTPLMVIRCGEQLFSKDKKLKLKKNWTSIDEMSSAMPLAAMAAEDQNFEEHFGFDFKAIKKAGEYNDRHKGKRIKGASTISQQTAKNVFLFPARSWIRKGFEVYFTFLIEVIWSKKRIMEVYLNVIEMGEGVYGAEAAAQEYFHKPAKNLSNREASLIAAVLPNPRKWSPARPTPYIQRKSGRIMFFMSRLDAKDF
ncbi:MAG: monofunctional biosynthetic peptidoglycan transglycosylase [Bacteroidetes bacterium]|nr:monofunctional biosynthetic peptidoglycan transglycosylase [Bacteroidota bacterium]